MRKILFFFLAYLLTQSLNAQLLNSVVNVSPYFPDASTLFFDAGDVTVSGAVEYPLGAYAGYKAGCQIDVTDTQIIISGDATLFSPASFNGWVLEVISGVTITSAIVDPGSDYFPVVSLVNGRVEMNFEGITTVNGSTTTINIVSEPAVAVPTLSQWGVIALGLVILIFGVGSIKQRQKQIQLG
ncbi:IPTL-CTERM sorting domain-containing protein [Portibacter lacus]|uniref:IPTL-CTERM protein sorting domain-containing protein n=1 Tax=Portibacter lacus TaxID=1099794 RepID=A0AA37ST49_9BACT|nr:IPTL-CTERM sorting domain-containing protein [Portibacter lacus]GLR19592.1 hypothetical protein GCM10007940_42080 [Portibacter lacus]